MKTVNLTPKASQDIENIWYYSCRHFGEEQAINQISGVFQVLSEKNIGTPPAQNWVNISAHYSLNGI